MYTPFLTGHRNNSDLILPQQPSILPREQASPQHCYTLQPQGVQLQIHKILKQHIFWPQSRPASLHATPNIP